MGGIGRLSVCAVPVQTRGSWGCEWGWVWRRVARYGLGFYCSSSLTFVALSLPFFVELRRSRRSVWIELVARLLVDAGSWV